MKPLSNLKCSTIPVYKSNISTNIGNKFLILLDRHFLRSHRLHKIFNYNNVKISYNSMPYFAKIVNTHNNEIINNNILKPSHTSSNCNFCNCKFSEITNNSPIFRQYNIFYKYKYFFFQSAF